MGDVRQFRRSVCTNGVILANWSPGQLLLGRSGTDSHNSQPHPAPCLNAASLRKEVLADGSQAGEGTFGHDWSMSEFVLGMEVIRIGCGIQKEARSCYCTLDLSGPGFYS
jgi:hypothetical protein